MKPACDGIRERRIGIAVEKERLAVRSIEFSARGGFGFLMCERKSLETRNSYQMFKLD